MVLFISVTGPVNCAVIGGYNSTKKLRKWKETNCEINSVLIRDCVCVYNPPYRLFKFPSILRDREKREKSIGQLRHINKSKSCDRGKVRSDHFVDGEPTITHPFPKLKLGYEKEILQPRRESHKHPVPPKKAKKHIAAETIQTSPRFGNPPRATS